MRPGRVEFELGCLDTHSLCLFFLFLYFFCSGIHLRENGWTDGAPIFRVVACTYDPVRDTMGYQGA